jgi:hypothetical protein
MGDEYGVLDNGLMYVESWAITPYTVAEVTDGHSVTSQWQESIEGVWTPDPDVAVECVGGGDTSVFLDKTGRDADKTSGKRARCMR